VAEFRKNSGQTTLEDGSGEETTAKKGIQPLRDMESQWLSLKTKLSMTKVGLPIYHVRA